MNTQAEITAVPEYVSKPDLSAAKDKLAIKVLLLQPPKITYSADQADMEALRDHLILELAPAVDAYIHAIGRFASQHAHISAKDLDRYFKSVVTDALQGDASYILETALADAQEFAADTRAETRWEFERDA